MTALPLLIVLMIAGITASCGGSGTPERQNRPITTIVYSKDPPATHYYLEDPACQTSQQELDLESTSLYVWRGTALRENSVNLVNVRSSSSLTSPIVAKTSYNSRYFRACDYRTIYGRDCRDQEGQNIPWTGYNTDEHRLKVCKPDHQYGRDSYEAVALASVFYLGKAYASLRKAVPEIKVETLDLEVLPLFISRQTNVPDKEGLIAIDYYLTDNLAYFPSSQMIAVFPEKAKTAEVNQSHLWESSFVLAHEFAHHVEAALIGKRLAAAGLRWNPFSHSYQKITNGDTPAAAGGDEHERMWTAISEGFADLSAFYSDGGSAASLIGHPTLEVDRDPLQSVFGDGVTPKQLTDKAVTLFIKAGSGMQPTSYLADAHSIGAILAFALNRVFSHIVAWTGGDIDHIEAADATNRYRLTLRWLQLFHAADQEASERDMSPNTLFAPIATSLQQLVGETAEQFPQLDAGVLEKRVCEVTADLMPAAKPAPFATDGHCPG